MTENLAFERQGPMGILTIDRAEKRNAISLSMWRSLPDVLAKATRGDGLRVLIVRGRADNDFSAGADIAEFGAVRQGPEAASRYSETVAAAIDAIAHLPVPTLALIHGYCVGGGCELALACDLRIAETNARFGITPAKLGLVYSLASTSRLVSAVGTSWARYLLLTATLIQAPEAKAIGLVQEVHNSPDIEAAAFALADRVAALATVSHAGSRAIVRRIECGLLDDGPQVQELYDNSYRSTEYAEGVSAFLARRQPRFEQVRNRQLTQAVPSEEGDRA